MCTCYSLVSCQDGNGQSECQEGIVEEKQQGTRTDWHRMVQTKEESWILWPSLTTIKSSKSSTTEDLWERLVPQWLFLVSQNWETDVWLVLRHWGQGPSPAKHGNLRSGRACVSCGHAAILLCQPEQKWMWLMLLSPSKSCITCLLVARTM